LGFRTFRLKSEKVGKVEKCSHHPIKVIIKLS
jgi:hypothetical protein